MLLILLFVLLHPPTYLLDLRLCLMAIRNALLSNASLITFSFISAECRFRVLIWILLQIWHVLFYLFRIFKQYFIFQLYKLKIFLLNHPRKSYIVCFILVLSSWLCFCMWDLVVCHVFFILTSKAGDILPFAGFSVDHDFL